MSIAGSGRAQAATQRRAGPDHAAAGAQSLSFPDGFRDAPMVKPLPEPAPAKINLFLRVVGRRADGYHELDLVFVPVSLCDQLRVEIRVESQSAADTSI